MTKKPLSQTDLYGELLDSKQQFRKEIAHIQPLNDEQQAALLERVRSGDRQAREEMVISFLPLLNAYAYSLLRSYRANGYMVYRLEHGDLVQAGSLAILEKFERALEKDNPFAWLNQVARYGMMKYGCRYESMVTTPVELTHKDALYVESLEVPLSSAEGDVLYADILEDASLTPQPEREYPHIEQAVYKLAPRKQTIIIRHYGLFGHSAEPLKDLQLDIYKNDGDTATHYRNEALMQLYEHLVSAYPKYQGDMSPVLHKKERKTPTMWLTREQVQRLEDAVSQLQAKGEKITTITLQREARMKSDYVKSYLYQQKQAHPEPDRLQKLEQAMERLAARGQKITVGAMVKEAHVARAHVSAYLRQRMSA